MTDANVDLLLRAGALLLVLAAGVKLVEVARRGIELTSTPYVILERHADDARTRAASFRERTFWTGVVLIGLATFAILLLPFTRNVVNSDPQRTRSVDGGPVKAIPRQSDQALSSDQPRSGATFLDQPRQSRSGLDAAGQTIVDGRATTVMDLRGDGSTRISGDDRPGNVTGARKPSTSNSTIDHESNRARVRRVLPKSDQSTGSGTTAPASTEPSCKCERRDAPAAVGEAAATPTT